MLFVILSTLYYFINTYKSLYTVFRNNVNNITSLNSKLHHYIYFMY